MATPSTQLSSDQRAASAAAVRLLREIVDYQRRLRRLSFHESSGEQDYLIDAYRRAIRLRGRLEITSGPGSGTTLEVSVPI